MKERIKHLIIFIVLVAIDQLSKYWVRTDLAQNGPIILIPDVFSLQYLQNTGAVWGMMSGKTTFLSIFTVFVLAFIVYLYLKIPAGRKYNALKVIVVFIMAGAIGNLIDRVFLGFVVDFIYFELINFPLFNFADSCLTVSSILLFILAVFYYKDDDFAFLDQVFHIKRAKTGNQADSDSNTESDTDNK
jgi:signal peptidase II